MSFSYVVEDDVVVDKFVAGLRGGYKLAVAESAALVYRNPIRIN